MTPDRKDRPIDQAADPEETTVGNYFVSNYPPFSCWGPEQTPTVLERLDTQAQVPAPLGRISASRLGA